MLLAREKFYLYLIYIRLFLFSLGCWLELILHVYDRFLLFSFIILARGKFFTYMIDICCFLLFSGLLARDFFYLYLIGVCVFFSLFSEMLFREKYTCT